jgi:FPC/CPF motif-containing protein YcgG
MPRQDVFGAIQEVVQKLEADPAPDWSKVNIAALREHLIDMNEVTLRAASSERMLDNGIEITVTGEGRTLVAIKRMVPAQCMS